MQKVVSTKDDLHPHRTPPLTLLAPCWRCLLCCHGCHVVAAIATVTIAAATATLPPAPFLLLLLPLFGFLPSRCLCFHHRCRCLPPPLLLLAVDTIVTVSAATNCCPLLLPPQRLPLFLPLLIPLFSLVMFKILLRPPHKSQKLIYKIYIFAQFSKLELVQIYCCVKHFNGSAIFTRSK